MNLYELERRYLASVMAGGPLQDLILTEHNEQFHQKIKVERVDRSKTFIHPSLISPELANITEEAIAAESLANEIQDVHAKLEIQDAVTHLDLNLPADALADELGRKLAKIATVKGKDRLMSARQLQAEPYGDVEFLVQDILPVGLTVLIGAPKQGKTWLLLLLAEVLSSGAGRFLWKNAQTCPVLYYSLEDGFRICKNRLGILQSRWSENLYIKEKTYGASYILHDIELTKARLVIIDTIAAFADMESFNSYEETTRKIRELKQIASTCDVAVVCAHHSRKPSKEGVSDWMAEGIGSQGIVGAADCVMSLQRKRGENRAKLKITGRAVPDCGVTLRFVGGIWERYREEPAQ